MSEEVHPTLLSVEGTFYTVFQVPSASLVAGGSHVSLTSVARAVCVGPSLPSGVCSVHCRHAHQSTATCGPSMGSWGLQENTILSYPELDFINSSLCASFASSIVNQIINCKSDNKHKRLLKKKTIISMHIKLTWGAKTVQHLCSLSMKRRNKRKSYSSTSHRIPGQVTATQGGVWERWRVDH